MLARRQVLGIRPYVNIDARRVGNGGPGSISVAELCYELKSPIARAGQSPEGKELAAGLKVALQC